jgi:hypothetical protein
VVYDATAQLARCLFCDSVALEPFDDAVPIPTEALPFAIDRTRAEAAFRRWARSSWWHPRCLRSLRVVVAPLWIPAWRFETRLELHWSGLERAPTRSGRRPRSGVDHGPARVLLPASLGLSQRELDALAPFDPNAPRPWSDVGTDLPYEMPSVSATTARGEAWALMTEERRRAISTRERLTRCRASALVDDVEGRLLMLPVFIGTFRHRDRPWRFVVNAQSGKVYGRAPLDRLKVGLTIGFAALVLVAIALWLWNHPPERPRADPHPDDASLGRTCACTTLGFP